MTTTSQFRLGTPLKRDMLASWKSLTPIYRGDDLIAFLGMEAGWKKHWKLYPIMPSSRDKAVVDGYAPNDGKDGYIPFAVTVRTYGKDGGDGPNYACAKLEEIFDPRNYINRNAKNFRTAFEQKADAEAQRVRAAENKAQYLQTQTTYQNDRKLRLEGLKGIMRKMGSIATEAEYSALQSTIIALQIEIDEHQRQLENEAA